MKTPNRTPGKSNALGLRYQAALRRYLRQASTANLKPAIHLGRQALRCGMETLKLASIHEQAVLRLKLSDNMSVSPERIIKRSSVFFAHAILPLEKTHTTALKTKARLSKLNQLLNLRTLELLSSNHALIKEISKRKVVERSLQRSIIHTAELLGQSKRLQSQMRLLSRRILWTQEEERKRISRELHDVIAQVLSNINVRLASLKLESTVNNKELARNIAHTQKLVEKSVDIVHQFAYDLRPTVLDDLGLIPALHSFTKRFSTETGIHVTLTAVPAVETLSNAKRTALYRVAHEALSNVARHTHATRVDVTILRKANTLCMQIQDDGQSFDIAAMSHARKGQHLGLFGMRERMEMVGGRFTIESSPGKGTTIRAQLPFSRNNRKPKPT